MDVREPVCRELGKNLSGRGNTGAETLRWEHAWHECSEQQGGQRGWSAELRPLREG